MLNRAPLLLISPLPPSLPTLSSCWAVSPPHKKPPPLPQEHKQHRGPVSQVLFSPDGAWLYSAGVDGGLCVYDVVQVYNPVKFLPAGGKGIKVRGC